MPSTYSPNLRIELIGNGEQTGTWGSTTNNNLGNLVESAIASHLTFDIAGSTVKYLQALNGVDDQARKMAVTFIGATANFRVYVPPAQKVYIFRNDTEYAAEIATSTAPNGTTKTGGTTMVTIPAGRTAWVFCDTTNNVRNAVDHIDGDLSVAGSLGVTGAIAADSMVLTNPLPVASGGVPFPVNASATFLTNDGETPVWGVTGIKTVVCATTADHPLTGLAAVDGISLLEGYRVLVKSQTAPAQNGIYIARAAAWTRADDFDTAAKIAGSVVNVMDGGTQGGFQYATSYKASSTLGVTAMTWVRIEQLPTQTGNTSKVLTTTGSTAAWVAPAAKAVYAATTANLTSLSGLTTTVDGVLLNVAGQRVLVKNQTTASQNGIYTVAAGAWTRAADAATALDLAGSVVSVQAGTTQGGTQYATTFKSTDTIDSTAMTWNPIVTGTNTLTQGTSQSVVGLSSVTFTGIPSTARRVTVLFHNVSFGVSDRILLQLNTTTSGYVSTATTKDGTIATSTVGFLCNTANSIATTWYGSAVLCKFDSGNTWIQTFTNADYGSTSVDDGGGAVTIASALSQITVKSQGGNTFDSGTVNIIYE